MPIASAATHLADETRAHGAHSTADELSSLIEALFDHVYRLWLAEFVHAGAPDAAVARQVVSRIWGRSKMLIGQRVGLARLIREVFVSQGLPTVVAGLAAVDFGTMSDHAHPVSRLIEFRNGFMHGGFAETVARIEEHRALVETLIERVPGFVAQPVMVVVNDGRVVALREHEEVAEGFAVAPAEPFAPFVVSADGHARLDLYPLWTVLTDADGKHTLAPPEAQGQQHTVDAFFQREALRQYAERWENERMGRFDHTDSLKARAWRALEPGEASALKAAVDAVQLVLVEGHPGCGKASALAALLDGELADTSRFADIAAVVVEPGEPAQSATTFAHFVLRAAERALARAPEFPMPVVKNRNDKDSRTLTKLAAESLARANRRVLILIEDAHLGTLEAPNEQDTLASVVRSLAGTHVHVVATAHPGAMATPFAHDRKVTLSVPSTPSQARLTSALAPTLRGSALHARVLTSLHRLGRPSDLFTVCDALEAEGGEPVLEPAVERALADLRPFLRSHRPHGGGERLYEFFHPEVALALSAHGAST